MTSINVIQFVMLALGFANLVGGAITGNQNMFGSAQTWFAGSLVTAALAFAVGMVVPQ